MGACWKRPRVDSDKYKIEEILSNNRLIVSQQGRRYTVQVDENYRGDVSDLSDMVRMKVIGVSTDGTEVVRLHTPYVHPDESSKVPQHIRV
jgi:hypothetical protein